MLAHGFTVDFLVELIRTGVRLPPSDIRNPRRRPSLSFFNMATIRSQRQAAGPSYLRIAKRAATL
jgi:hypothetical protein